MSERNYHLHDGKKGAALAIRITPRATSNQVADILHDGTVRIRLNAAPGNEANSVLKKFLSSILDVPVSDIDVIAGENGHDKLVSILNLNSEATHKKIIEHLA